MAKDESKGTIKKTVVLNSVVDRYIRMTWSIMIEQGYDATYSMALNYMLLIAILESCSERGLSEKTMEYMQDFLKDQKTIDDLNLQERLGELREHLGFG